MNLEIIEIVDFSIRICFMHHVFAKVIHNIIHLMDKKCLDCNVISFQSDILTCTHGCHEFQIHSH